jgi:glutamine synthetase
LPWTSPRRGEVRVGLYELDGSPMAADPRHALALEVERFNSIGMFPVLAFELEFYLLDHQNDPSGRPRAAPMPLTGDIPAGNQVYSVSALDQLEPFAEALYQHAGIQGLPIETLISEYAPGQYELTLHHRDNALRAADDLVMLKRLIRGLALRQGMRANFMAKPFAHRAGSGMHLHASLADERGGNLFADTDNEMAALLRHAIGGVQQTMAESMLVFAPNLNSWRRFSRNSYAPTAPTWGRNNRTVAIRIPAGNPVNRHLEHRAPGVDANPYLVAAVVLAGIRHGIERKLEPEAESFAYKKPDGGSVPRDWRTAIERASMSSFMMEALGERLASVFVALKQAEYDRFAAEVTMEEIAYYGDAT